MIGCSGDPAGKSQYLVIEIVLKWAMFSLLNPSTCICCGEAMVRRGGALSRNPNMCASCSSLADGMQDLDLTGRSASALFRMPVLEKTEDKCEFEMPPHAVELAVHDIASGPS